MNLTSDDIEDLRRQDIAIDDENEPDLENILYEVSHTVNYYNWKSKQIILPRRLNNLHHYYAVLKYYHHDEVTEMMKLEQLFILFTVDYLKYVLIPKMNNILKNPMGPGKYIRCLL